MAFSRIQKPRVLPTRYSGMPELKPSSSITSTLGWLRLASTSRQPFFSAGLAAAATSELIVDRERGVVGEARVARDRAGLQLVTQRRRRQLVVDAPTHVVG